MSRTRFPAPWAALAGLAAMLIALGWPGHAAAQPASAASAASGAAPKPTAAWIAAGGYSEKGADTCLVCHDEEADSTTFTTAGIFRGRHGHRGDPRAPFGSGGLQCEACHGPGARHATKASDKKSTINSQKSTSFLSASERNEACLACHRGGARSAWHAGAHERADLGCTDCHKLHARDDPVRVKASQPDVCFACHQKQRSEFHRTSSHPVRFGRMACSDCHNAHGANSPAMLVKTSVNQTCFTCHADKRGPLLWEHAPVAEDCSLCHSSHGSVRPALLNKTPPLLCQQCHAPAGHPSVARTGAALPGGAGGGSIFLLAGSCTNCHTQVHGSNHPSGARLMR